MFLLFNNTWRSAAATGLLALGVAGAAVAAEPSLPPAPAPWSAASPGQFWAELDYLAWTVKGDRLPALVTSSPGSMPPAQAGVRGAPGTTALFGDSAANDGWRSGGRLTAGYWFDRQQNSGVEASAFGLENLSDGFRASSDGNSILARPFFNAATNQQDAQRVAAPGGAAGSVTVRDLSRLLGAGALYRQNLLSWGGADPRAAGVAIAPAGAWGSGHVGVLIGYRYRYVSDRVDVATTMVSGPVSISISDQFNASNNFHGLDLGLSGDVAKGPWSLEWRGKVAVGANLNDGQVTGSMATTSGGVTTVTPAGLLASANHSGNSAQMRFAVMPELTLKLAYQVAPQWRIVAGYDAMYWSGVRRAGDMANAAAGAPPPGGPADPQRQPPPPGGSALMAQGWSIGLKYAY